MARGVAGIPAFPVVRLDGARMERKKYPRAACRRASGLFRTDLARHVRVRTPGMARPWRSLYARVRDLCAFRAARENARGPSRHPRAAAGGRLARESSLDDIDGRAGDCPFGDRHIRWLSRNSGMGAGRFGRTRLGIRLAVLDSAGSARGSGGAGGSHLGPAWMRCAVSGSVCGRVLGRRGGFRRA